MLPLNQCHRQIRFSGAAHIAPLADKQHGPTCGFESIENLIQLFRPAGNNLTETDLIPRARHYGLTVENLDGPTLAMQGYLPILTDYHIPAAWYPVDFQQVIVPALLNNLGVVAIGDAYPLNPSDYPPNAAHAFLIANLVVDVSEQFIVGFSGIDSNFAQESWWPFDAVYRALAWGTNYLAPTPVLVTGVPIQWPGRARYYKQDGLGNVIAVG